MSSSESIDWSVLNPFVAGDVKDDEIWGEEVVFHCDVQVLHAEASEKLLDDLHLVADQYNHMTRVRFIVGQAGTGKSHVFSRLRRASAGRAAFALARNPPLDYTALPRWTLDNVMKGLRRPWMQKDTAKPYSQLEAILYLVLQQLNVGMTDGSPDKCHEWWLQIPSEQRSRIRRAAVSHLVRNKRWARGLTRVLFAVLEPECAPLAFQWLSGVEALNDTELEELETQEPLNDAQVDELFRRLGPLATMTKKPMFLVLDQLEQMTSSDHIAAFSRLLTTLIEGSKNWLVAIGLREEIYDRWQADLDEAIKGKLRMMEGGHIPVVEITPIRSAGHKHELISQRLRWPPLTEARKSFSIESNLYPLDENDLDDLSSNIGETARKVLENASARYIQQTVAPAEIQQRTLAEELDGRFRDVRTALNPDVIVIDRAEFADRLVEMVVLCARYWQLGSVTSEKGPLETAKARATDRIIRVGSSDLRILTHNVQSRAAFPSFLKRAIEALPPGAILVRDGAVGVGGTVTAARIRELKQDKVFLHLSRPAIADMYAMGSILAEEREGNFSHLKTKPPPTRDNVMLALSNQDWFVQNPFVAAIHEVLDKPAVTAPTREPAITPPPEKTLVEAVQEELRATRWLMLERLFMRLCNRNQAVEMQRLRAVLSEQPLCDLISRHPVDMTHADVQILIWQGEGGDA